MVVCQVQSEHNSYQDQTVGSPLHLRINITF